MFKVTLRSYGAFPIFNNFVPRKRLVVDWNGRTIGPLGQVFSVYRLFLTVKCSKSVWGHSVHFWFSTTLYLEMAAHRAKRMKNWTSGGKYAVYKGDRWQLSVQGHSDVIRCISDFQQPWKWLVVERNGRNLGFDVKYSVYTGHSFDS